MMHRLLVLTSIILFLNACTTQVTSLEKDQDLAIGPEKGYLLLGIQTNRDLKSIDISGPQNIQLTSKDIKQGTGYLLVDLKAGVYTIEQVLLDDFRRRTLDDEDYWQFEVLPEKISYVGHLELKTRGFFQLTVQAELVNRSSEALQFLMKEYPTIYSSRQISYGGPGSDRFFDYLSTEYGE